MKAMISEWKQ